MSKIHAKGSLVNEDTRGPNPKVSRNLKIFFTEELWNLVNEEARKTGQSTSYVVRARLCQAYGIPHSPISNPFRRKE